MKSVLITGAYGGMGKETTKLLRNLGYKVFALDIKTEEIPNNVIPIQCDITSESSVINAFETVKSHTDELYAIIHYAGIYMLDSLVEMETESFKKIFDINIPGDSPMERRNSLLFPPVFEKIWKELEVKNE